MKNKIYCLFVLLLGVLFSAYTLAAVDNSKYDGVFNRTFTLYSYVACSCVKFSWYEVNHPENKGKKTVYLLQPVIIPFYVTSQKSKVEFTVTTGWPHAMGRTVTDNVIGADIKAYGVYYFPLRVDVHGYKHKI